MGVKLLLNAGCGAKGANKPPSDFAAYKEVRLDMSKAVEPDIVASITAMPMIDDGTYDAVFCSHTLEHLYAHEVANALGEFMRVLKPGGMVMLWMPDLQSIGGRLALDQPENVLYTSAMGPISLLDMIYGHRGAVCIGHHNMAHRTGYTQSILQRHLDGAGFVGVKIERERFELKATAVKAETKPIEVNGYAGEVAEAASVPERHEGACVG